MSSVSRLLLTGAMLVGLSASAPASGTYPPAPPRLPADVLKSIDAEQYNLGKALFTGRSEPAAEPQGTPAEQTARRQAMADLVARLPERVRADANLEQLAPRLTDREAAAITYYATRRFQLAEPSA